MIVVENPILNRVIDILDDNNEGIKISDYMNFVTSVNTLDNAEKQIIMSQGSLMTKCIHPAHINLLKVSFKGNSEQIYNVYCDIGYNTVMVFLVFSKQSKLIWKKYYKSSNNSLDGKVATDLPTFSRLVENGLEQNSTNILKHFKPEIVFWNWGESMIRQVFSIEKFFCDDKSFSNSVGGLFLVAQKIISEMESKGLKEENYSLAKDLFRAISIYLKLS